MKSSFIPCDSSNIVLAYWPRPPPLPLSQGEASFENVGKCKCKNVSGTRKWLRGHTVSFESLDQTTSSSSTPPSCYPCRCPGMIFLIQTRLSQAAFGVAMRQLFKLINQLLQEIRFCYRQPALALICLMASSIAEIALRQL